MSERYEVIDGQQRINALSDYYEGAFKLFDPLTDQAEARFPNFIKTQPCPWGGKAFHDLDSALTTAFLQTNLRIVQIETHNPGEARDLFVRLQAGMPLNSQEKRDAWPGQFTDFILKLGGKSGLARYPGHDFFNVLMKANRTTDRGKFRQLAAQIAMLVLTRRSSSTASLRDINSHAIDDFYYENLDFDSQGADAVRLWEVLDAITNLLRGGNRPKILGHEAIHLALLADQLMGNYALSWRDNFANAFDAFREEFAEAKYTKNDPNPSDYWLRYGVLTRVNSDRADAIQQRHEFFVQKMLPGLHLKPKDSSRVFGPVERELIYYRDKKRCAVCESEIPWDELEIHHVDQHSGGGRTVIENGAPVHKECHPKGSKADEFAQTWKARRKRAVRMERERDLSSSEVDDDE